MNRAIGLWVLGILLLAGFDPARAAGPADAVRSLPQAMQDKIAPDPAAFARKLAFLAASYGENGSLSAAALDRMAATLRARARAAETARLMAADLDGDGAVSGDERRMALAALSAPRQKRLEAAWAEADADKDGQVSATELAQQARVNDLTPPDKGEPGLKLLAELIEILRVFCTCLQPFLHKFNFMRIAFVQ